MVLRGARKIADRLHQGLGPERPSGQKAAEKLLARPRRLPVFG